ncbi:MAG: calcium/sodium antiporter [Alphaproteobacteria bacterium]|nr:calcium/sodium antiporter [Alphaproteobacteria bacterium]
MEYILVIAGLFLLIIGGDKLVEGSVALAERLHVSKLIIGITVVSFGTSAPELVVGIQSALSGVPNLALGNIVGSNIANILLVLGIPAIFYPFACDNREIRHSLFYMVVATLLFVLLAYFGPLNIWQGSVMIILLGVFLFSSIRRARKDPLALKQDIMIADRAQDDVAAIEAAPGISLTRAVLITVFGLAGLIFGAHILVDGAIIIARMAHIPEAVIGLTIIAIGTSLPELTTSIMAARNNHGDVAMGNIIGSNLFNILAIMGVTSILTPVSIPAQFFWLDFPIMVATALILVPVALGKISINRLTGFAFLLFYILYLLFLARQLNLVG